MKKKLALAQVLKNRNIKILDKYFIEFLTNFTKNINQELFNKFSSILKKPNSTEILNVLEIILKYLKT